jgi:hypothetical protein
MDYAEHVAANHPIGSGVTEAACKTIVKQRLGQSGMRWKDKGDKLDILTTLVQAYEDKHYPIDLPDAVDALN